VPAAVREMAGIVDCLLMCNGLSPAEASATLGQPQRQTEPGRGRAMAAQRPRSDRVATPEHHRVNDPTNDPIDDPITLTPFST
jgi:hypothetical protein